MKEKLSYVKNYNVVVTDKKHCKSLETVGF